ncbi:acyltransferase family protein [Klebsiella sp. BIGb0407]|uniref:acyltransferase family protein n=1 Tax=Klebsiella sp. BIGb0407 TaxID=2940603 RepID=UPI00216789A7|nr:acyltransferase family protein [Klebsiella sp. BIGb0407]MCS3430530.1 peptidoglycan/LPS O-acetylase OafA/YrhL [Klebsiella sp. BIGb0407]
MKFRHDINGLRAIAVIAVVLFHFKPTWIPGGFAGVDVFFVISGYLMTAIIFKGIEANQFNLIKFYSDRANRIIPALAVVCVFLLLFSYFFINVLDQIDIHRHVNGSLGFFSNFIYLRESGYFDVTSHEKWLLHTWSLSVEWQFYIFYPIALIILKRFVSLSNLKIFVFIGTVISLVISIIVTIKWPTIAYYSLPTRAWEMMIGGLAFLYPLHSSKKLNNYYELIGISLIIGSYFLASSDTAWPGYLALFPVVGAYLMIIANKQESVITNNILFQYIGKWSYSIYLWHWPIVIFGFYFSINNWYLFGMPLSVLMGFLSYQIIENKRYSSVMKFSDVLKFKPFLYLISVFILGYVLSMTNGLNSLPDEYKLTKRQIRDQYEGHMGLYGKGSEPVYINSNKKDFDFILIGDSFARHYYSFLKTNGFKVVSFAVNGCYSTRDFYNENNSLCENRYDDVLEFIKNNKNKIVIISQNWNRSGFKMFNRNSNEKTIINEDTIVEQLGEFISIINQNGSAVYVIGNDQGADVIPFKAMAEKFLSGESIIDIKEARKNNPMGNILDANVSNLNYHFLDISESLCDAENCFTVKDGQSIYTDHGHLSKFGSNIVGSKIFNNFK